MALSGALDDISVVEAITGAVHPWSAEMPRAIVNLSISGQTTAVLLEHY